MNPSPPHRNPYPQVPIASPPPTLTATAPPFVPPSIKDNLRKYPDLAKYPTWAQEFFMEAPTMLLTYKPEWFFDQFSQEEIVGRVTLQGGAKEPHLPEPARRFNPMTVTNAEICGYFKLTNTFYPLYTFPCKDNKFYTLHGQQGETRIEGNTVKELNDNLMNHLKTTYATRKNAEEQARFNRELQQYKADVITVMKSRLAVLKTWADNKQKQEDAKIKERQKKAAQNARVQYELDKAELKRQRAAKLNAAGKTYDRSPLLQNARQQEKYLQGQIANQEARLKAEQNAQKPKKGFFGGIFGRGRTQRRRSSRRQTRRH